MKSIAVSEDLPDYLKSKYSVLIPHQRTTSGHKSYKSNLKQGVSEESPRHFKVNYIPVLSNTKKNSEIGGQENLSRYISNLKQNLPQHKSKFDYSEIKSQRFDFDTLGFAEGMDVKAGNSARLQRAMAYSNEYSKTLNQGFGIPRGDFNVEISQPSVPRLDTAKMHNLAKFLELTVKKEIKSRHKPSSSLKSTRNKFENLVKVKVNNSIEYPRHVNTPNRTMRPKKNKPPVLFNLEDLDLFDADIKSKQSLLKSTAMYKDY
jgi:hypothetical protein